MPCVSRAAGCMRGWRSPATCPTCPGWWRRPAAWPRWAPTTCSCTTRPAPSTPAPATRSSPSFERLPGSLSASTARARAATPWPWRSSRPATAPSRSRPPPTRWHGRCTGCRRGALRRAQRPRPRARRRPGPAVGGVTVHRRARHLPAAGAPDPPRITLRTALHRLPVGTVSSASSGCVLGAGDRLDEVLDEFRQVRLDCGMPPLAQPIGGILAGQAVTHVLSAPAAGRPSPTRCGPTFRVPTATRRRAWRRRRRRTPVRWPSSRRPTSRSCAARPTPPARRTCCWWRCSGRTRTGCWRPSGPGVATSAPEVPTGSTAARHRGSAT